jgi:hypothetical protein
VICYFVYIATHVGQERAMFVATEKSEPDPRVLKEAAVCFLLEDVSQERFKFFRVDGHKESSGDFVVTEENLIAWIEAGTPKRWKWEHMLDPYGLQARTIKDAQVYKKVERIDHYPNDSNAVGVHQTWVADTKEAIEALGKEMIDRYPPGGYGTSLRDIKLQTTGPHKDKWTAQYYRSLSCD